VCFNIKDNIKDVKPPSLQKYVIRLPNQLNGNVMNQNSTSVRVFTQVTKPLSGRPSNPSNQSFVWSASASSRASWVCDKGFARISYFIPVLSPPSSTPTPPLESLFILIIFSTFRGHLVVFVSVSGATFFEYLGHIHFLQMHRQVLELLLRRSIPNPRVD